MAAAVELSRHVVALEQCGAVDVLVSGDLETGRGQDRAVFLSLHGLGGAGTWVEFFNHEDMRDTRDRSLVVHVCLPGQAEAAPDLEAEFPELGSLGMSLVTVLDQLRLPRVVVLGEGAGANIAARFAINHPSRVAGLVLVNLKTAVASLPFKLKALGRAARTAAEDSGLNPGNVAKFEAAYKRRDDLLGLAAGKLAADTLVICGAESSRGGCARAAEELRAGLEAGQCSVLILEEVASVLAEAADKLADSLILFCQGLGLVPSVQRKVSRSASVAAEAGEAGDQTSALPKPRKISMEMFDIPNIRRLSLTSHNI